VLIRLQRRFKYLYYHTVYGYNLRHINTKTDAFKTHCNEYSDTLQTTIPTNVLKLQLCLQMYNVYSRASFIKISQYLSSSVHNAHKNK